MFPDQRLTWLDDVLVAFIILCIASLFLAAGCSPHRAAVKIPDVNRPTYSYREVKPDTFVVWVYSGSDAQAKEELCTRSHICTIDQAGHVIVIERKRK